MQRDRTIGLLLVVSCLIVLPLYIIVVFFPAEFVHFLGIPVNSNTGSEVRLYAGLVPTAVGLIAILLAGLWIGVSILTSRPKKDATATS
jgi:hypothetical protein